MSTLFEYRTVNGEQIYIKCDYILRNGSLATITDCRDGVIYGTLAGFKEISEWTFLGYAKEGKVDQFDIIKSYLYEYNRIGRKDDTGKNRHSLLIEGMPKALSKITEVLEHGAKKYDVHNWQKVENGIERYKEALYRHVLNLDGGLLSKDKDSGLLHLAHIACNALFLMELIEKE